MFRSSENAAMDRAIDMCKEMDDELDDCFRTLQRLNAKYNCNDSVFVNYLGLWDENDDGDKPSTADTDDTATDEVTDRVKHLDISPSKVDLENATIEETAEGSKDKSVANENQNVEIRPIGDARTYNGLDKTYKDLSVKCIKLRRDLESSSRQLMHILEMADRAKDAAQSTSKY